MLTKKQNLKLDKYAKFCASYKDVLEFEETKKNLEKIKNFKDNHSDDECKEYENNLTNLKVSKINSIKEKLAKKYNKKKNSFENKNQIRSSRVWEIDFLRGIIIIGMLIDHFIGDFWMITGPLGIYSSNSFFRNMYTFSTQYWMNDIRVSFRLLGVMFLLIISGVSAVFSKKTWKRALIILLFGGIVSGIFAIISIITNDPESNVIIGAVTCIGLCLLIYALVKIVFTNVFNLKKQFKWISLGIALFIIVGWFFVVMFDSYHTKNQIWFAFNNYANCVSTLKFSQINFSNFWKIIIGLNYFGSDWLPLFPYLGYMFLGGFIGETFYINKKSLFSNVKTKGDISMNEKLNKATAFINFPGRKSMWFYVIHQPLYIVIIILLALCMGVQLHF